MTPKLSLTFIIICLILVATSAYPNSLKDFDHDLFSYVHSDMQNKALDKITPTIQRMGEPQVYFALCALLCAFGNEKEFETGKLAITGFAETGAIIYALKETIRRPRPLNELEKDSFPSGHSGFAFTLATIVSHNYPKLRIPLYLTAFGTAFSRIYLGRHYPSDVLVGAAIGTLVGLQITHYKKPILKISF
jgi:undecaprenyl-diphosphatase